MKKPQLLLFTFLLLFIHASLFGQVQPVFDKSTGNIIDNNTWIPHEAKPLQDLPGAGPYIQLHNGVLLMVDSSFCFTSSDKGKTWKQTGIFTNPSSFKISGEHVLLETSRGMLILAFSNLREASNLVWDSVAFDFKEAILPAYVTRSSDGGRTWETPQKLHNSWTGANRSIIETRSGAVVFTSMMMRHNPCHHTVLTYTSFNDGKDWTRSNIIDLGGRGDHSGVTESCIVQLNDGRLWQLMRTNWGCLWQAYSKDEGLTWTDISTTTIDASSAPAMVKRLSSGRLILLWNRRFPSGKNTYPMRGGNGSRFSEVAVINHREELSVSISDDDGKSWSLPKVIAKNLQYPNQDKMASWIAYPFVLEPEPGLLWITTMQGGLKISIKEADCRNQEKALFGSY
ncbi:MAG: exo-alpha-sialidase [Niabella sp.]|nr:exo-alpha-sialidase [Niabella sp.]